MEPEALTTSRRRPPSAMSQACARYEAPRATMPADRPGVRGILFHRPAKGVRLRRIGGTPPSASLHGSLLRRLSLEPTDAAPALLERVCRRDLARLRRARGPLF